MSELSMEVKLILQHIDNIDRQRIALWQRRERLIKLLEKSTKDENCEVGFNESPEY